MNATILKTTLAFLMAGTTVLFDGQKERDWTTKLVRTVKPEVRKSYSWATGTVPGKTNPAVKVRSADPSTYYFDYELNAWRILTQKEERAMLADRARKEGVVMRALDLLRNGDSARAKAIVRPLIQQDDLNELATRVLSEALLHEDQYGEALALLVPQLENTTDSNVLTMAAYAGAMRGEVFSGQREYCNGFVLEFAGNTSGVTQSLPQDAKASSALARAVFYSRHGLREDAKRYYIRTLELDNNNAYAAYCLGQVFEAQHAWSLAAKYYRVTATHGTGELKLTAKTSADWMAVRAERGGG